MALNFGILQPVNIGGQIMAGEQEAQRNQLAQQQLETGAMQLDTLKRDRDALAKMQKTFVENGKSANLRSNFEKMIESGISHYVDIGYKMLEKLDQQERFESMGKKLYPELFGSPATELPIVGSSATKLPIVGQPIAPPITSTESKLSSGASGALPANALAPSVLQTTPVNALAASIAPTGEPLAKTSDQLRREIMLFSQSTDPRAKTMAEILKAQLTESLKAHVIAPNANLVVGGKSIYEGAPAPTETSRLQAERAALIKAGVPLNDPRIQEYDQKLAFGESQSAKLQRELLVAKANNAPPAVIAQIQRDIRNLHPGLAMQNVTGVDAQGNQIVTRFAGTGGGPQGQFALDQAPTSTARAMLGLNEADSALLFGPGGAVEKGLVPVGRLTPSNARMFVAAVKANPNLNFTNLSEDQVSGLAQARAEGTIKGKQVLTLADRSTAQNIANGNLPPLTGPNSSKIMNEVIAIKPDYRSGDYGLQTSAVKAFNQGTQGNKVRSLNVVMEHFTTLEKAADALQSGDVRAINAVSQFIQTQTGKPAPTNFNAVKEILADEIVAAVVPGVGALADRVALKKTILAASSPEQLKGIVANYKELIGGQLTGLEKQYSAGTGRTDFKSRYLTPAAAQGLAPSSSQYIEIKDLPGGRKLGKKADGTVEEIK